ncbi:hypothetical protein GW17_00032710 [Ensete ventricosum]|nr:hypothetical protein GW17_00032710 [Ensete ventricosum]
MGEVDLNKCEPWDLPVVKHLIRFDVATAKARMGEKEWYFFCQRDRKYPTGMRTNRATEAGYWKATGKDKEIHKGRVELVGMKKTLVFYRGRAPKGLKTNWVMHEFRLDGKSPFPNIPKSAKDEWAVCKVFHKKMETKSRIPPPESQGVNSLAEDFFDSATTLPPLVDPPYLNTNAVPSFSAMMGMEHEQAMNHRVISNPPHKSTSRPQLLPQSSYFHQQEAMVRVISNPPHKSTSRPQLLPQSSYFHQQEAMVRAFAAVNDASSACPSQDTDLRTDRTTEISSMVSARFVDFVHPSSGPAMDLESIWDLK